jgi:metal-responsive CopG/Arc/MetJ family transcriptional regulator
MPGDRVITTRIPTDLYRGLADVAARDGVLQSEQVRRAIRTWLDSKGISVLKEKSERKRAGTRRRS